MDPQWARPTPEQIQEMQILTYSPTLPGDPFEAADASAFDLAIPVTLHEHPIYIGNVFVPFPKTPSTLEGRTRAIQQMGHTREDAEHWAQGSPALPGVEGQ